MVMYNTSLAMGNRLPAAHSIQTEMDNNFICVGASLSVEAVIAILRSSLRNPLMILIKIIKLR